MAGMYEDIGKQLAGVASAQNDRMQNYRGGMENAVSQVEYARAYNSTKEGQVYLEMAEAMHKAFSQSGLFYGARQSMSDGQRLRVAHQLRLIANVESDKAVKSVEAPVKAFSSAIRGAVEEGMKRRATSAANSDAYAPLFDMNNPTVTAIAIAILETVVNADITALAYVKTMTGMFDSIILSNLVAKDARGGVVAGTIVSGSLGQYAGGYTSNMINVSAEPIAAETATFTATVTVPANGVLTQGTVLVRVVQKAADTPELVLAFAEDGDITKAGVLNGWQWNPVTKAHDIAITGTVDYASGAVSLTLASGVANGAFEVLSMVSIGSNDQGYGFGTLQTSLRKKRLAAVVYGTTLQTDTLAQASNITGTGLDTYEDSVRKMTGVINADYARDGVMQLKFDATRTYDYKAIKDVDNTNPDAVAKYAFARFNFLFALGAAQRDMTSVAGRKPNTILCGTKIAALLQSFEGTFKPEPQPRIDMIGEHKIGRLESLGLDVVISPRNLQDTEALLYIVDGEDNSSLVAGEFLASLEGLQIPGVLSVKDVRASLKGFGKPLDHKAVYRFTADNIFSALFTVNG